MFNAAGGTIVFRPQNSRARTPTSIFSGNQANGGDGGIGALAGTGNGGHGGTGGPAGVGGSGGFASQGNGGFASAAGDGLGGALDNNGVVSFVDVTINITNNQANGGAGGPGGTGGQAVGGDGGSGVVGGRGGDAYGGTGGSAGAGGMGAGGGIFNTKNAILTIDPRFGAKKRSPQTNATNTITGNEAAGGMGGAGGQGGSAVAGLGGNPNGTIGRSTQGVARESAPPGAGMGGGLAIFPGLSVKISNTNITANKASTTESNVLDLSKPVVIVGESITTSFRSFSHASSTQSLR
jgi:hypothetical protein